MICQFAKSDMTPCFEKDRVLALFDKGGAIERFCVGCERRVYPTNAELTDYDKLKSDVETKARKKKETMS